MVLCEIAPMHCRLLSFPLLGHVSGRDCAFEFKSKYSKVLLGIGAGLRKACVYRSNCSSEVNVYFSGKPVTSHYDSYYKTSRSYDRQNKIYTYTFSFPRFGFTYNGLYHCVIHEIGNKTNQMTNDLVFVSGKCLI